jgi:hypothetical protein
MQLVRVASDVPAATSGREKHGLDLRLVPSDPTSYRKNGRVSVDEFWMASTP